MKVGDLVKYNSQGRTIVGLLVGFDEDDDTIILGFKTMVKDWVWRRRVELLYEGR